MAKKIKWSVVAGLFLVGLGGVSVSVWSQQPAFANTAGTSANARAFRAGNSSGASASATASPEADAAAAKAAFERAYPVFVSPRCQNCHPAGDAPLQGDDSHVHAQYVKRGPDGQGLYAMTCHTCHQDANLPGAHMPPGNPKWALPPAKRKMVFVGKTAGELCRQLKDPKQNGGRTIAQIITHVSSDDLVGWGWNPGDGRTLPPLSRPDFAAAMQEWANDGAACPD